MRKCFHCNNRVFEGLLVWTFVYDTAHLPNSLVIHQECFLKNEAIAYWINTGNNLNQAPYKDETFEQIKKIVN